MKTLPQMMSDAGVTILIALALGSLALPAAETGDKASFAVAVTGHGHPMILIPGLSSSGAVWDDTVAHFKDHYECHVLTLAGFAGQPRIEAPFLETVRNDLATYIRNHKMDRPVIIGHSLGGFLALWLASHDPNLAGPLVIVDSLPFYPAGMYPTATIETARPYGEQIRAQTAAGSPSFLQGSESAASMMVTQPKDRARVLAWLRTTDPVSAGNAVFDIYTHDLREDISRIVAPTLELGTWVATKDFVSRDEMEARIRRQYAKLTGCRIIMAETGHFIMLDDPGWFLRQIDDFIAEAATPAKTNSVAPPKAER